MAIKEERTLTDFQIIEGSVTSPKGFRSCGIHTGIKRYKKDLALIVSDVTAEGAGLFTTNKVCAAPVTLSRERIREGNGVEAILVNSGNANACTGIRGYKDAKKMTAILGEELTICPSKILIASTGVIGVPLPMETIEKGIKKASKDLSYIGGNDAAEAILTTDTGVKKIGITTEIDGKTITIGGMAKGSGMIDPNLATMLVFLTTDVKIDGRLLQKMLEDSADRTYNMITVDGDMSTNDTVFIMANGMAENEIITEDHPDIEKFRKALDYVNEYLAKAIVLDGEGATKFIEVEAQNSKSFQEGKIIVKNILNSNLVKTAFFGEDGNWGRIMCSIGYSDAEVDVDKIDIFLGNKNQILKIVEGGLATDYDEKELEGILKSEKLKVLVNLNIGNENVTGWGCDLSYKYVEINGAYRS